MLLKINATSGKPKNYIIGVWLWIIFGHNSTLSENTFYSSARAHRFGALNVNRTQYRTSVASRKWETYGRVT